MSKRRKFLFALAVLTMLLVILGVWMMPRLLAMLPGQYRQRLPPELLRLVVTPLTASLPAPANPIAQPAITIPAIMLPSPSPVPSRPVPTVTDSPPTVQAQVTVGQPVSTPILSVPASATATPEHLPSPTPVPTALPVALRIDGLKIVPQKFNNCGPSNLSINLSYYGHHVEQLEIADVIRPNYDDRNVSPEELAAYVNERTPLKASFFQGGDLPLLKRLLASGFPVVIEEGITPSEWEGWMGHYLTLIGFNDVAGEFLALDTLKGPWDSSGRSAPYVTLDSQWRHFNYTFFVVYPLEQEPVLQDLLGPEMLNPTLMFQRTALLAQRDIDADAEDPYAWFNLGTSLTRLGQLTGRRELARDATAAFDQARAIGLPARMLWYQFTPYEAYLSAGRVEDVLTLAEATLVGGGRDVEETYLYRGHALLAKGDGAGAREAYRRAIQLNPGFELAQEALDGSS